MAPKEPGQVEMAMMFHELDEIEAASEHVRRIIRPLIDSGAITLVGYHSWRLAPNGRELLAKYLEEHPDPDPEEE